MKRPAEGSEWKNKHLGLEGRVVYRTGCGTGCECGGWWCIVRQGDLPPPCNGSSIYCSVWAPVETGRVVQTMVNGIMWFCDYNHFVKNWEPKVVERVYVPGSKVVTLLKSGENSAFVRDRDGQEFWCWTGELRTLEELTREWVHQPITSVWQFPRQSGGRYTVQSLVFEDEGIRVRCMSDRTGLPFEFPLQAVTKVPAVRQVVNSPVGFAVGDVVHLKSGSPPMTVEAVRGAEVTCTRYINGWTREVFDAAMLVVAS